MVPLAANLPPRAQIPVVGAITAIVLGILALIGHELGILAPSAGALFDDWVYEMLLAVAALVVLARAMLVRVERRAWAMLAAGLVLFVAGDTYYTVVLEHLRQPPFPSLSDAGYLAFYPCAYGAIVILVRGQVRRFHRSVWLDGAIGGLAVAAVAAEVVLGPVIRTTEGSFSTVAVNLAYPVADMLLAAFVVGIFVVAGWRPGRAWLLIGLGFGTLAIGDSTYLYQVASGDYRVGTPLDSLWPVAFAMLALAAWQRPVRDGGFRFTGFAVTAGPGIFTLVAVALLIRSNYVHMDPIPELFAALTLMVSMLRIALTFREVRGFAEVRAQAQTDELTQLANRRHFYANLQRAIAAARARGKSFAVLVVDLDGFKEFNDTLGHFAGDLLLEQVGPRLQEVVRRDETLARLGGDEFGLILQDVAGAEVVARRIDHVLHRPFDLEGLAVTISASVGIAIFPDDARDADSLLQRADVAMYEAKETRSIFEFYVADRDLYTRERLALITELRDAVAGDELVLHYQPKLDLSTGRTVGVEALVRWRHPRLGLIAPDEFLPLAEQTGVMRELTGRVLDLALAQERRWLDRGLTLAMSVNITATNLRDERFPEQLAAALRAHRVPAELLELEIIESVLMARGPVATRALDRIAALGVEISLDDFGTGYSPLAYLKELRVDELKIDRSFIAAMGHDKNTATIVGMTIELAHRLAIRVVAEGVESTEQLGMLRSFGCQFAQGFLFSRPLPATELAEWLEEQGQRPPSPAVSVAHRTPTAIRERARTESLVDASRR